MTGIFQLIYISSARRDIRTEDCTAILSAARTNNAREGVTGMLLFNSRRFLQVLEGDEHRVRALYERIRRDPRHAAIVLLSEKAVPDREFGEWAMAFDDGSTGADLKERTLALMEKAGPSTRALFETTATLHRG